MKYSQPGMCCGRAHLWTAQVKAMCSLPSGGVPTTFLNSQQTKEQRSAVLKELNKVRQLCGSRTSLPAASGCVSICADQDRR